MHVHFIEPRADGHRMQFVRRLVQAAPQGARLSLSTFPTAFDHPGTRAAVAASEGRLQLLPIGGEAAFEQATQGRDGFRLQPAYWRLFRRHWRSLKVLDQGSLVVVPYLDYCSYAIGLLGSPFGNTSYSGIVMRPDFQWRQQGVQAPPAAHTGIKAFLFRRLLRQRRLHRLVTIDPSLRDWTLAAQPAGGQRLAYAHDPADLHGVGDRAAARMHFGLPQDALVLLVFGSIDMRKGIRRLVELMQSPGFPPEGRVLLVGRLSDEVRDFLAANAPDDARTISVPRYVTAQEEWLAFAAADLGWAAYDGFYGPSGFAAQCAQMGLPMVHAGVGIIGYLAAQAETVTLPWLARSGLQCARLRRPGTDLGLEQVFGTFLEREPK